MPLHKAYYLYKQYSKGQCIMGVDKPPNILVQLYRVWQDVVTP